MESEQVSIGRLCECNVPKLIADKPMLESAMAIPGEMINEDAFEPNVIE